VTLPRMASTRGGSPRDVTVTRDEALAPWAALALTLSTSRRYPLAPVARSFSRSVPPSTAAVMSAEPVCPDRNVAVKAVPGARP